MIENAVLNGEPNDEDFDGLYESEFISRKLGHHFSINIWVLPNGKDRMYCWSTHKEWEARHWLDEGMVERYGHRRLYIEVLIYDTREGKSKAINEIDLDSDDDGDDEGDDESEIEIEDIMIAGKKAGGNGNLKGKGKGKVLDKQVMKGTASSDGSTEEDEGDTGDEIVVAQPKSKTTTRKRTTFDSDEDEEPGPPNKAPRMDFGSRYH